MLKQGLYEQLINQELKEEIRSAEAAERQRVETGAVDAAESARVLAEYVAKSYPAYWEDLRKAGFGITEIQ